MEQSFEKDERLEKIKAAKKKLKNFQKRKGANGSTNFSPIHSQLSLTTIDARTSSSPLISSSMINDNNPPSALITPFSAVMLYQRQQPSSSPTLSQTQENEISLGDNQEQHPFIDDQHSSSPSQEPTNQGFMYQLPAHLLSQQTNTMFSSNFEADPIGQSTSSILKDFLFQETSDTPVSANIDHSSTTQNMNAAAEDPSIPTSNFQYNIQDLPNKQDHKTPLHHGRAPTGNKYMDNKNNNTGSSMNSATIELLVTEKNELKLENSKLQSILQEFNRKDMAQQQHIQSLEHQIYTIHHKEQEMRQELGQVKDDALKWKEHADDALKQSNELLNYDQELMKQVNELQESLDLSLYEKFLLQKKMNTYLQQLSLLTGKSISELNPEEEEDDQDGQNTEIKQFSLSQPIEQKKEEKIVEKVLVRDEQMEIENTTLKRTIKELESQIETLQEKLETMLQDLNNSNTIMKKEESRNMTLANEFQNLNEIIIKERQEKETLFAKLESMNSEIGIFQNTKKESKLLEDEMNEEINHLIKSLEEANASRKKLMDQNAELEEKLNSQLSVSQVLSEDNKTLDVLRRDNQNIMEELKLLRERHISMNEEKLIAVDALESIKKQNEGIRKELDVLKAKADNTTKEQLDVVALQSRINDLEQQLAKSIKAIEELRFKDELSQQLMATNKEQITTLTRRLSNQVSPSNVASMAEGTSSAVQSPVLVEEKEENEISSAEKTENQEGSKLSADKEVNAKKKETKSAKITTSTTEASKDVFTSLPPPPSSAMSPGGYAPFPLNKKRSSRNNSFSIEQALETGRVQTETISRLSKELESCKTFIEALTEKVQNLTTENQKLAEFLEKEKKVNTLLSAELDVLPEYIVQFHEKRKSLVQKMTDAVAKAKQDAAVEKARLMKKLQEQEIVIVENKKLLSANEALTKMNNDISSLSSVVTIEKRTQGDDDGLSSIQKSVKVNVNENNLVNLNNTDSLSKAITPSNSAAPTSLKRKETISERQTVDGVVDDADLIAGSQVTLANDFVEDIEICNLCSGSILDL